jgi:ketosteroid isomerase-like protein
MMVRTSTSEEDAARPAGDIVRNFYEALEAGQVSQALGVLARNVEWVEAEGSPYGGESALAGRRAVWEALLAPLAAEWERLEMLREDIVEAGSAVRGDQDRCEAASACRALR